MVVIEIPLVELVARREVITEVIVMPSYEVYRWSHPEANEDGKIYFHAGYDVRKCKVCGREFICGRFSARLTCGYPDCGKGKELVK